MIAKCPECGKECREMVGIQKYLYGGRFHLYTAYFMSCGDSKHEFQTEQQLQKSIDEANKIREEVNAKILSK